MFLIHDMIARTPGIIGTELRAARGYGKRHRQQFLNEANNVQQWIGLRGEAPNRQFEVAHSGCLAVRVPGRYVRLFHSKGFG